MSWQRRKEGELESERESVKDRMFSLRYQRFRFSLATSSEPNLSPVVRNTSLAFSSYFKEHYTNESCKLYEYI